MIIRQEKEKDFQITEKVVEMAFKNQEFADGDEYLLVQRMRKNKNFIPGLSLVAEIENKIVGHILFSIINVKGNENHQVLSLAPVSVLPEYQRQGIGKQLVEEGLKKAREMGYKSVLVVGHPDYYPKFGFERASKWGIYNPFEVPDEVSMALELKKEALSGISGIIEYPVEFGLSDKK